MNLIGWGTKDLHRKMHGKLSILYNSLKNCGEEGNCLHIEKGSRRNAEGLPKSHLVIFQKIEIFAVRQEKNENILL